MTSSPGRIPAATTARCRAAVQLLTAMACLTPQRAANSDSRRSVASPMVIQPLRKGSCTAANSSDPKSGSNNGTRQFTIRPSGSFVWQEALAVLPEFLGSILVIFRAPDIQPHAIEGVGSNGLPTSQHV